MADKRNHCRADPPSNFKGKRPVVTHVDKNDYRKLYELTMISGCSMQETLRRLVRDAFVNAKGHDGKAC